MAGIYDTLTADWLKKTLLFDVDTTNDEGVAFPNEMFELAIDAAVELVEAKLDVILSGLKTVTNERYDVTDWDFTTYYLTHLRKKPVREVTGWALQYGTFPEVALPKSWVHVVSEKAGQIQIIPGPEGITGAMMTSMPGMGLWGGTGRIYTPAYLSVTYKAGFDGTKHSNPAAAYPVPMSFIRAAAMIAAMLPLDTAGDLIVGAGIANKSISMDGISASIGTTSSATNAGYGARIQSYKGQLKELWAELVRAWRMPNMMAV